jgi:hypothetical protein
LTRLSFEVRGWIGLLLVLQLLTSLVAMGLLTRVSPAVEQILEENVYSIEAAEAMVVVLARDPNAVWGSQRTAFMDALERAATNVTEPEEEPLIGEIRQLSTSALGGDRAAREDIIEALVALTEVNRRSMGDADLAARRLGAAGAWAAAFAGMLGVGLGVLVLNRLIQRLVVPVLRLDATLDSARRGDDRRRCVSLDGPVEVVRMGENLNWLLDASARAEPAKAVPVDAFRAALLSMLDVHDDALVVVGPDGVLAVNQAAYARATRDPSPAAVAAAVLGTGAAPPGWQATRLAPKDVWICREEQRGNR